VKNTAKESQPKELQPALKQTQRISKNDSDEKSERTPLDLHSPLEIPGVVGLNRYMEQQESTLSWKKAKKNKKRKEGKKKSKKAIGGSSSDECDDDLAVIHQVNRADGEMPDDAKSTDEDNDVDDAKNRVDDQHRALDINLDEPLRDDECLPVPHHRLSVMDTPTIADNAKTDRKMKKKRVEKSDSKRVADNENESSLPVNHLQQSSSSIKNEQKEKKRG